VTPEAEDYLKKARDHLDEARKIAGIGLAKAAARSAYYAALHAAQSFIVERTGKIAKTHSGVRSAFARLAKETTGDGPAFSTFLANAYVYKDIADYGVGGGAELTIAEANDAIAMAERFIGWAAGALD
jgi:uncharacterized protein (UPF0332 family)